jgi:tRNA(fMet)-specific endonuclease VapC
LKYLLDTNTCIRYLNGRSPHVKAHFASVSDTDVRVCSVVKAELYFGAARSTKPTATLKRQNSFLSRFESLPFDDRAAAIYGPIRADLERGGSPIGPNDLLIAAIALANGLKLITNNTAEFSRIPGLALEDWEKPIA